jgi:hypothetical protein
MSRLGLILALTALFIALIDVTAILLVRFGYVAAPPWADQAQGVVPQAAVALGAAGVALNLLDTWRLLARKKLFDPRETQRDLAIDDLAGLLSRAQQGCLVRVAVPLGLIVALIALVLSLWNGSYYDNLRVVGDNVPETCTTGGAVAPFAFVLDNSASAVSISWSAQPTETLRGGMPWARIDPNEGTVDPGQSQRVEVIPDTLACYFATASVGPEGGFAARLGDGLQVVMPQSRMYHVLVTSAGQTHRETVLGMEIIGLVGRATPSPTAIPTPIPTPVVPQANLHVTQNQNVTHSLCSDTAYSVSLSDAGANVPVGWSFQPVEYNYGAPWAITSPASGTVASDGSATVQVIPQSWISCNVTYHATLQLVFPDGGFQTDIAVTFNPGPPPTPTPVPATPTPVPATPNLHITQDQFYSANCYATEQYTVILDNTGGNVPVQWSFVPTESYLGSPWADASPASGTVGPGGSASFQVTLPAWIVCGTTYHATLQLSFPQGGYQPNLSLTYTGTT